MLRSQLFKPDPRLQACLLRHEAHVLEGDQGPHVTRIQLALMALDGCPLSPNDLRRSYYGLSTAAAVLDFKSKRSIINRTYQTKPDAIVGKMTIARMDDELFELGRRSMSSWPALSGVHALDSAPVYLMKKALVLASFGGPRTEAGSLLRGGVQSNNFALRQGGPLIVSDEIVAIRGLTRAKITEAAISIGRPLCGKKWRENQQDWNGGDICWKAYRGDAQNRLAVEPSTPPKIISPTNWCGIFATYIWSAAATGRSVAWYNRRICFQGDGNNPITASLGRGSDLISPGDILVECWSGPPTEKNPHPSPTYHHVLIISIHPTRRTAEVLEGNAVSGADQDHTIVNIRPDYPLDNAIRKGINFYSVDTLLHPQVKYGYT